MHELRSVTDRAPGFPLARRWPVILAVFCAVGCESPTELPELPATTQVEGVDFRELRLRTQDEGWGDATANVIRVSAIPVDRSYILGPTERIPVVVSTAGGDREELLLGPMLCPIQGVRYVCTELTVVSDRGAPPEPLAQAAASVGAKIFFPRICSSLTGECGAWNTGIAYVQVAAESQLSPVTDVLRWVPRVRGVARTQMGEALLAPNPYPVEGYFELVDQTVVTQHDGIIQAPPGDSVLVSTLGGRPLQASMEVARNVEVTVR